MLAMGVMVLAMAAVVGYLFVPDGPTIQDCIDAIERAGGDTQLGNASEEYYVSFNDPTFGDEQLKAMLVYIRGLEPLANLSLVDSSVSDASVNLLAQCQVGVVNVGRTRVSEAGAAELQQRMPWTYVGHESTLPEPSSRPQP